MAANGQRRCPAAAYSDGQRFRTGARRRNMIAGYCFRPEGAATHDALAPLVVPRNASSFAYGLRMEHRYEIRDLDKRDPDAVEKWTRAFCSTTPLPLIRGQFGETDDRRVLARRIARTFPKATREAAYRGPANGFSLSPDIESL